MRPDDTDPLDPEAFHRRVFGAGYGLGQPPPAEVLALLPVIE